MNKLLLVLLIATLNINCGYEIEQTGESQVKIDITFQFLEQLQAICQDSLIVSDFETIELYRQAVADCILNTLELLDLSYLFEHL
jgi:hypothetical protein